MLLVALMTGLVGGLRPTQILQALYHGCGRLVWMFILYWLYNPILELMDGLHAYQGLLEYTQPLLEGSPRPGCALASSRSILPAMCPARRWPR